MVPTGKRKSGLPGSTLVTFDDELGFVPPDEFIPLAKKNGMINEIGEYVF